MRRLEGKTAFITGVARGQGRSHAVRFAEEGARIIGVDLCAGIDSVGYPLSRPEDLAKAVTAVQAAGGQIVALRADVRDRDALSSALDEGLAAFGGVDVVLANAGILPIVGPGATSIAPSPTPSTSTSPGSSTRSTSWCRPCSHRAAAAAS